MGSKDDLERITEEEFRYQLLGNAERANKQYISYLNMLGKTEQLKRLGYRVSYYMGEEGRLSYKAEEKKWGFNQ